MKRPQRGSPAVERLAMTVPGTQLWFPDDVLADLTPAERAYFIAELRKGETMVRSLRKRLEALQSGSSRECKHCGRPVTGRADAVFCSSECRVRHHRGSDIGKRNIKSSCSV